MRNQLKQFRLYVGAFKQAEAPTNDVCEQMFQVLYKTMGLSPSCVVARPVKLVFGP
jgi:hypothetical protein